MWMVNARRVMCAVMTISATSVEVIIEFVVMVVHAIGIMSAVLTESATGVGGSMTHAVRERLNARRMNCSAIMEDALSVEGGTDPVAKGINAREMI